MNEHVNVKQFTLTSDKSHQLLNLQTFVQILAI